MLIKNYNNVLRKICEKVKGDSDLSFSVNRFWGRDINIYFRITYDNKGLWCYKIYRIDIEKETCKSIENKLRIWKKEFLKALKENDDKYFYWYCEYINQKKGRKEE